MRTLVLAFFFVSGICGLLYEVVWIRIAGTVIGNTTFALGTVVGVFMGGLAAGAWAGGRAADRRSGAALLRLYGVLEGGIAISAAAVPLLLTASEPVFKLLWNSVGEITALYAALRVVLMGLVLAVPTTLMGATLPILTRFLSDSGQAAAGEAGRAYAINTFGGVVGTLASGLWLIPTFGLRATTWVAVALNLAIGAAALALARGKSGAVEPALSPEPPPRRLALVVSALSGFAALVYEVAWTRSLVLSLGSTVTAFTLILTAFILGLAAGSAVASRVVHRARDPEIALAAIQASIGTVAVILLPVLGNLPLRMASVPRERYSDLLWTECGVVALVVFVPTLLIGAVFPFTFRMASASDRAVGRSVAAVYTWNTIGSIAGSLAASFALIPAVGLAVSLRLAATINLSIAAALLVRGAPRLRLAAAAPGLLGLAVWLLPSWNDQILASGAYLYGDAYVSAARAMRLDLQTYLARESTIVARHWDAYGLTTVHKSDDGSLSIRVNGKADASTGTSDMPTQRTVGNLGMLHHPAPRRALVIGLGSGVTLGAVAGHPVGRVDCIEISPAGARAAEHFSAANGGILKDGRVRLVIGDGRNALQFAKEPYDVIVSQPSNLWVSGMANLFTREFFATASGRLTSDGVFCQWVHAYRMPIDDFRSILRTFFDVFPEGSLWEIFPGQDYLLLGSTMPIRIAYAELEARLKADAAAFLGRYVAGAADVRIAVATAPLLSDDRSTIEYTASRAMFTYLQPRTIAWVQELRRAKVDPSAYPGAEVAAIERSRESRRRIARVIEYEGERHSAREVLELLARETGGMGDDEPTREHFERIARQARLDARLLRSAGRLEEAIRTLAAVPQASKHRADALLERANVAVVAGRDPEAALCFEEIRSRHAGSFAATCLEAQIAEKLKRPEEAVARWRAATALRPDSEFAFAHLGAALAALGRADEARRACARALELDPQNALARDVLDRLSKR